MFRRRRDPEIAGILAKFEHTADRIESAQRALLAAVPKSRDAGLPLPLALNLFADHLAAAEGTMPDWNHPRVAEHWETCARAIAQARAEAERLRAEPGTLSFEALNARIADVIAPLETFADVERTLRGR